MVVALSVLAMGEEALRDHQMEIVLGARHCDIEEPPLLLNLFRSAGAEVRRNTSIDDIQHEDRLPFLAMIPVNGSSFGRAGGRLRRYPGGTENASILATVRGSIPNCPPPSRRLRPSI